MAENRNVLDLMQALAYDIDGFSEVAPFVAVSVAHWILEDRAAVRAGKWTADRRL